MPRTKLNPRPFLSDEAGCLQLIEALADGNPIPDTSSICPDRHQLIALLVEISRGERSELFEHARQVAEHRGLPAQEIASRATFLLACLDTPGADDPYAILGVASTATDEEIKEAWLGRLSLYHPDRHSENGDWFTQQAARLNEAYHTLKDPARRYAYNERRRRDRLTRERDPFTKRPVSSWPPPIPSQLSHVMRHRAPVLVTAVLVAVVGLVVMALSGRQSEGPQLYIETVQPTATVALPPPVPINGPPSARLVQDRPASLDASITPLLTHQLEWMRIAHAQRASLSTGVPAGQPDSSDNQIISARSAADPILLVQALPPIVLEPKGLDRQEIDALLDEYVDAYEKADIERVMATLSTRVREKGTLDYQTIRNAYVKGFTGRDQIIYRLKNVQVDIKGEQATVTAQYLISARNAAQSAKGTTVSGRIEWKIQREGEKLKIVSINY